jgi:hypothetical protein
MTSGSHTMQHESNNGIQPDTKWLTVSEAAALLKVSERTVRRRCEAGKLSAQRESNEFGVVWLVEAAAITAANTGNGSDGADSEEGAAAQVQPESVSTAATSADDSKSSEVTAAIAADNQNSQIEVVAGEVHQLRGEIEQLKAFIVGGAMQAINERLATLPDVETLRAAMREELGEREPTLTKDDVASAVEQGITAAVEKSAAQEREELAVAIDKGMTPVLERLAKIEEENRQLRTDLQTEREQRHRGLLGWFRRG